MINLHAVQPELEKVIKLVFTKPMFQVPFETLPSTINFHRLKPRENFSVGDIQLCPYELDHYVLVGDIKSLMVNLPSLIVSTHLQPGFLTNLWD